MDMISPPSDGLVGALFGRYDGGALGCDSHGRIVYANAAAAAMFGWTMDELRARTIADLMPPAFAADHQAYVQRYETTGKSGVVGHGRVVQVQRRDGTRIAVRLAVFDLRRAPLDDERIAYVGLLRDVSAQIKLQTSLVAAKASAQIAQQASRDLLARVTHLLRTPLNSVLGFAELLADHANASSPERIAEYANDIHAAGMDLMNLVNNLLSQAQLHRFEPDLQEAPTCIEELFDASTSIVPARRALHLNPSPHLDCLLVDRRACIDALRALVDNAFRYTTGAVEVGSTLCNSGEADLWVRDQGDGFVFGAPVQADSYLTDRNQTGLGLGLSIARSAVELHGGSLHIEPAKGGGTIASLRFPASCVIDLLASHSIEQPKGARTCPFR